MKKITRENFEGLRQRYPVLNKEEMRRYVGGNFSPYDENEWLLANPYAAEMNNMDNSSATASDEEAEEMENDLWGTEADMGLFSMGGYGYSGGDGEYGWDIDGGELPEVVIYGHYYGERYTEEEYWDMVYNGTWNGGYVDGMGYAYAGIYSFPGEGDYYTFPEYLESDSMTNLDYMLDTALDKALDYIGKWLGLTADYWNHMENAMNRIHNEIQSTLLQKGYDASSFFYINHEVIKNGNLYRIRFNVYNAKNGEKILSREIDMSGNIY